MKGIDDRSLLLLDRKDKGRTVMFLFNHRWLLVRGSDGGGPHVSLYRRIAHWMMKDPKLEME